MSYWERKLNGDSHVWRSQRRGGRCVQSESCTLLWTRAGGWICTWWSQKWVNRNSQLVAKPEIQPVLLWDLRGTERGSVVRTSVWLAEFPCSMSDL